MSSLSLRGQPIIMGVPGPELNDSLRNLIKKIQPGGFILFARNLASPGQVFNLIRELNQLCEIPPVVTVDQEGGRVSRLNMIGEKPPSAYDLCLTGETGWCHEHGVLTGRLLSLFGFNLNLAPVLDFCPDPEADNSLKGRCFGKTPEEAAEKAGAFIDGMKGEGVLATVKHFPGYTFCRKDPHGVLPKITRSKEEIFRTELLPFKECFKKASAVMIGHAHFTAWHEEPFPASLSPKIVTELLRENLGYDGLSMTDDLEMGAIANAYGTEESTRLSLEAGEDMLLICHNPACVQIAYELLLQLPEEPIQRAVDSIQRFKKKLPQTPKSFDEKLFQHTSEKIRGLREKVSERIHG